MKVGRKYFWGLLVCAVVSVAAGTYAVDYGDKIVKKVPTTHKVLALTFDDGPYPGTTENLLTVLKEKHVRGTFFVLGSNAERYPQLLAEIVANGHEVASHSYTHRFINRLSKNEFEQEIVKAENAISRIAPKPTLFRPPGGGYNDRMVSELAKRGYTTVLWSIDPRDWEGRGVEQIVNTVVKEAAPGGIILLHEGKCAKSTAAAVEILIDRLREKGYEFVTVSGLLRYYEMRP
ncbi:polysaccharide deacetylase [Lucifera butyrica]|uniref:Polysaccharide deacetylase n=1 Tax=Lucifera butyrica TaxID=1351585 RepID=A0A498R5Z6_9FIRM|nr:polysaccharide deacetylase family protein [Lucifera butyrica]VBB06821.1 polysaccharide deacetylase [Lucifera butyrica]